MAKQKPSQTKEHLASMRDKSLEVRRSNHLCSFPSYLRKLRKLVAESSHHGYVFAFVLCKNDGQETAIMDCSAGLSPLLKQWIDCMDPGIFLHQRHLLAGECSDPCDCARCVSSVDIREADSERLAADSGDLGEHGPC